MSSSSEYPAHPRALLAGVGRAQVFHIEFVERREGKFEGRVGQGQSELFRAWKARRIRASMFHRLDVESWESGADFPYPFLGLEERGDSIG